MWSKASIIKGVRYMDKRKFTVKELIEELQKYDENCIVEGVWEGISVPVHKIYYWEQDNTVCLNVDND